MHFNFKKAVAGLLLACTVASTSGLSVSAASVTTPYSSLPKNTKTSECYVKINSSNNQIRNYHIFYQRDKKKRSTYIRNHGCAVSSLTTVLSAYSKKYEKYTPEKTSNKLEKKVFGSSTWKANYNRKKMPISLNGITKILNYCGIKAKYVRFFKDASAVKDITAHLNQGKPVIIEVNNQKQYNGKFSKKYTNKWASSKHTIVLLGIASNGKVIVADSANRNWSGNNQRIKYTTMNSIIHYMYPCTKSTSSYYYKSLKSSGGYILVD